MTKQKRDAIAAKAGLTKTDDGQFIGTRRQWQSYDDDCVFIKEMEADIEMTTQDIIDEKIKADVYDDLTNEERHDLIEDQGFRWGEGRE